MMRHISLLLVVILSGCASINTWDEVGRSCVQIADLKVELSPDGSNVVLKVIGEKHVPLVPFLCKIKREGEVDTVPIIATGGEFRLCLLNSNGRSQTNNNCSAKSLQCASVIDYNQFCEDQTFMISTNNIPLLVDDLHRHRSFMAIQAVKKDIADSADETAAFLLQQPYIDYQDCCYVCPDEGLRVIVGRIVFMPFALIADAVFMPIGLIFAPFIHM